MKRIIPFLIIAALAYFLSIGRDPIRDAFDIDNSAESDQAVNSTAQNQTKKQPTQPHEIEQQSSSAIQSKTQRQDAEATRATGLSKDEIDQALEEVGKAFFDPSTSGQYQADIYAALVNTYGEEEAQFRMALMNEAGDWEAQKELVAKRRAEMPSEAGTYDQMLLQLGIANGQITQGEVELFVRNGAQLPADSVLTLASNGKVDLIVQLTNAGLLADNSIRNVLSGHNAIASYVSGYSYSLENRSPENVAADIEALYRAGVPVASSNIGIDPLDSALATVSAFDQDVSLAIIERLLNLGATVEDSHRKRLAEFPPGDTRARLERLLRKN